jgi:hypothetical protein
VKSKNRPVVWAALGKEEAINWDEDHLHLTASHPQQPSPNCPSGGNGRRLAELTGKASTRAGWSS